MLHPTALATFPPPTALPDGVTPVPTERPGRSADDFGPFTGKRVHFIGIGGSGMRGLAEVVLRRGGRVTGSDKSAGESLDRLKELGAVVHVGQREDNVPRDADYVVASAAVKDDNPELAAAKRMGLRTVKYAKMLGLLMRLHRGISISGTHGKSTTTGMVSYILTVAGKDPTFVCGAQLPQLGGGARVGSGEWFVAESCEYDRSFHNLFPQAAAILNIEEDHLDCYGGLEDIVESFRTFAHRVPADGLLAVNGEDPAALRAVRDAAATVETFGLTDACTWQAVRPVVEKGVYSFDVLHRRRHLGRFRLAIPGLHHVRNALAAMALTHYAGVGPEQMREALADYTGADRRLTVKGRPSDVTIVDDYGHHPTEVAVTLKAAREHFSPKRLWCIFQPHQHSRTRHLLKDFAASFRAADKVLLPDIYFVRDSAEDAAAVSSRDLVKLIRAGGGDAEYVPGPGFDGLVRKVAAGVEAGDCVVTMGAGDIWKVADELVRRLGPGR
jgi:UDP-N-acetylmuramate--alanine ligase